MTSSDDFDSGGTSLSARGFNVSTTSIYAATDSTISEIQTHQTSVFCHSAVAKSDMDYSLHRVILRSAAVGAVIVLGWGVLYATLGLTPFSTILGVMIAGIASVFL